MTPSQKRLRTLRDRQSKERQRMAELSLLDSLDAETRAELDTIEKSTPDLERQLRAAAVAADTEDRASVIDTGAASGTGTDRLELRSRASIGRFLLGAATGKVAGAEAELQAEMGLDPHMIPLEMFDAPREARAADPETRAITPAPGTVGVNLDPLRPMVFAPSIVDKLMIEMPTVESGTYATGTITTAATADAVKKGAEVPETAGAFTVTTTTPHRVGASLNLSAEDIATVGSANFESILRQHISLVLSDDLDDQLLNGDGSVSGDDNNLFGILARLADPTAPGAEVAGFDAFVASFADSIDGLWAGQTSEVSIVAGVDTYRLSAQTFRDATADLGSISFADYAMAHTAGWWTNKRMPAAVANIQQAIVCRKGRSMTPTPTRLAVCPTWGYLSVEDIFTGARKGERRYVLSVLVGDIILVQPDAYAQVAYRVAT